MSSSKNFRDPRGHSLRIYDEVFDSPAFRALSPHDVLAYLALLRELKQYNNGDLSLPLSRAKKCGISHSKTLARSLRAVRAVGLVAITRKGGCDKGGERLPTLYRVTDFPCFDIPAKFITARPVTNDWKKVATVEQGIELIEQAERAAKAEYAKKNHLGHAVLHTKAPCDPVKEKTRAPSDPRKFQPGHRVIEVKKAENPITTRVCDGFSPKFKNTPPRARHSSPLHIAIPVGEMGSSMGTSDHPIETLTDLWAAVGCHSYWKPQKLLPDHGTYKRLTEKPKNLFTGLLATNTHLALLAA